MSGALRPWLAALLRPRGNAMWDSAIRGSAALAVAGIVLLLYAGPSVAGIVGFVVVTIWINGPLGLFLPATYEPIVMAFGRLYPPVLVALAGILGTVYVEFFNYHLYARVLQTPQLSSLRAHPVVRRILPLFRRAPFFTVWLCSWSLLPHWSVRILAPLAGYPVARFLAATFLGRFPRLWFFAALGALPIPRRLVVPVVAVGVVIALALLLARPPKQEPGAGGAVRSPAATPSLKRSVPLPAPRSAVPGRPNVVGAATATRPSRSRRAAGPSAARRP